MGQTEHAGEAKHAGKSNVDWFTQPKSTDHDLFFTYHPRQMSKNAVVKKVFQCEDGTNRKWLTYCEETHTLYCSVCIAHAKPCDRGNSFIVGMRDWRHIHQRIGQHKQSFVHRNCAETYSLSASKVNINHLLCGQQMSAHREQVRKRRQVLL